MHTNLFLQRLPPLPPHHTHSLPPARAPFPSLLVCESDGVRDQWVCMYVCMLCVYVLMCVFFFKCNIQTSVEYMP